MVSNYVVDGENSFLSYGGHFYKLTVFVGHQLWLAGKCVSVGRDVDDLVGSMNHIVLFHNFGYGCGLWKHYTLLPICCSLFLETHIWRYQ